MQIRVAAPVLSAPIRSCGRGAARFLPGRGAISTTVACRGAGPAAIALLLSAVAAVLPAALRAQPRLDAAAAPAAAGPTPLLQPAGAADPLGVWLTTVDSDVLRDRGAAARAIEELSHNGFSRAAVPLYSGGSVTWPLDPARNRFGVPLDPALPAADHVSQLLGGLGRRGLRRLGWMEFGLMAPAEAPWLRGRQELLLRDRSGSTLWTESPGLERVWLNPAQSEVQAFLEDLVVDGCTRLPLEAIQFDDHLGYPSRFGYDATSLALWRATPEGAADPSPDPEAPAWLRWRADQVTALLQRLRGAMRRHCPQVKLSLAPNPREFSYRSSLADWAAWIRLGLVDELVVQIYRWDPRGLERELSDAGLLLARQQVPLRIGLLAGLRRQPKQRADLLRELDLVRSRGFDGIDLFFYDSLRPHLPLQP